MAAARGHFNLTTGSQQHQQQQQQYSSWHCPIPYLFGGLAAMLGLIAFALMLLACSYWRLSGHFDGDRSGDQDIEAGGVKEEEIDAGEKKEPAFTERVVVIMAGEERPTFLATMTPMWSGRSPFLGDNSGSSSSSGYAGKEGADDGSGKEMKQERYPEDAAANV